MKKIIYLIGVITPIVYILAVIIGGALWSGYSHARQPISELTMASSPVLHQVGWIFTLYGLLLLAFGLGLTWIARKEKNSLLLVSGVALFLCSIAGLLMAFAPQDPIGTPLTVKGLWHLILAGIASLTTLLAIFFAVFGFSRRGDTGLKNLSLVFGFLILISGPITAIAPAQFPQYFGIIERITIGSFIIWLFIASMKMFLVWDENKG